MHTPALILAALAGTTTAVAFPKHDNCPPIHVLAARATTEPRGYGSASTMVNLILGAYHHATSEAIDYPAAGGNVYGDSVVQGVAAVANQTNTFNARCPHTRLVLVGYSQGGQIMDDALCGGGDSAEGLNSTAIPMGKEALEQVKAAIFMGDPRHVDGLPYNVGNATAPGGNHQFDPRPVGFKCPYGHLIQSYCDSPDPYCAKGNSTATHQGYGAEYGQAALQFVKSKLDC